MRTVHKVAVPINQLEDVIELGMPADAHVLSVGNQNENLCLWYETDTETHTKIQPTREFRVAGTGHPIHVANYVTIGKFLGTVIFANGSLVFHIYEASTQ